MSATPQPAMTPESVASIRDFMLQSLQQEQVATKNVLKNVKPGDWKPDPKSRSAMELAWHVVSSEIWFLESIAKGRFDNPDPTNEPKTIDGIIEYFERGWAEYSAKVQALSGEQLLAITDFYGMKMPLFVYLNFALVHTVHHRGQLSTYLRALGGKVPDIYGGSADEPWQGPQPCE